MIKFYKGPLTLVVFMCVREAKAKLFGTLMVMRLPCNRGVGIFTELTSGPQSVTSMISSSEKNKQN